MNAILIIAATAVIIGGLLTWAVFIFLEIKEGKSTKKIDVKYMAGILLLLFTMSCTPCRNLAGDGYMVWVQEGVKKNYRCVENLHEADIYIFMLAGLDLDANNLIGKWKPYFHFDNGDFEIYVEQESSWKKRRNDRNKKRQ